MADGAPDPRIDSAEDEAAAPDRDEPAPPVDDRARGWKRFRRFAPLILVAGAAAAGSVVAPHVPHDRTLQLELSDPSSVTRVDLAWDEAALSDRAIQGASFRFQPGSAPTSIRTNVRLPNGRYDLDVTVERGADRRAFHRVITLGDSDRITIPIR